MGAFEWFEVKISTRFEVFKRDLFTCRYCGRRAPDVILEVDHVHPRSQGGDDELLNLVTSCWDCNRGKGDKTLRDSTKVDLQRDDLELEALKLEQQKMLAAWSMALREEREQLVDGLIGLLGIGLNEAGRNMIRRLMRQYGYHEVSVAIDLWNEQYGPWNFEEDGDLCDWELRRFEKTINKLGGICWNRRDRGT